MDVLYVVGNFSKYNNKELKYSLRSLAKNCKNVGKVYIVGYKPDFVSDEVIYIPCDDTYATKCKNIQKKVLYAVNNSDISNDFLLSSDDIFHIKTTDLNNYPYYIKNGLNVSETIDEDIKKTHYYQILLEAKKILERFNYPLENCSGGHCLHHFDKGILLHMPKILKASFDSKYGVPIDLLMGNAIYKIKKVPLETRMDVKIGAYKTIDELKQEIKDVDCFSINNEAMESGIERWLQMKFPKKCKYEK